MSAVLIFLSAPTTLTPPGGGSSWGSSWGISWGGSWGHF